MSRPSKLYTAHGETLTLPEWAKRYGVSTQTLGKRLHKGEPLERALRGPDDQGRQEAGDEAWPGARDTPWEEDDRTWYLVATRGPMQFREIAKVQGCSPENIRQIEYRALKKLAGVLGAETADVLDLLQSLRSEHTYPASYAWDG